MKIAEKNIRPATTLRFITKSYKYLAELSPYIILFVITIIVFCNTLGNAFVYDDSATIVNNTFIKNWKNFHSVFSFNYFILSGELSYRPVVTLTYFIDYSLWGLNPLGFHLTNILLHTLTTILFYIFLKRIINSDTTAFISTIFFAIHPILTETINCISYREDILSALFFLTAFILFIKIDKTPLSGNKLFLYYPVSLFSYLFSLFSKEMAVSLPILLILYNVFCSSPRNTFRAILKKTRGIYIGYFLVTGFYLFIQFGLFRDVYIRLKPAEGGLPVIPKVLASYIKLLLLPFPLNADYVIPTATSNIIAYIISTILLTAMVGIIIRLCKNSGHARFFILWFFVALLPVSNIVPLGNFMAERYLYIPYFGFCGFIGILIRNRIFKKTTLITSFTTVTLLLCFLSIYRNGTWRDEFTLWSSTSDREPNSARAHHNLGVVYSTKGLHDLAELEYKKTLLINPQDIEAHFNLGNAYNRKGLTEEATKEYTETLRLNPYNADAYNNLGNIYKDRSLIDLAEEQYKKAIQYNPFNPHYHNNLGLIYHGKKLYREAVAEYKKALKTNAQISSTHNYLGNSYKEMGNFQDAMSEFKTALSIDPSDANTHNNLGIVYTNTGQLKESIREFKTAIQLNPKLANVHNNLGIAYAKTNNQNNAIDEMRRAVTLGFDNADVHNNMAGVFLTNGLTDNAITELKLALKFSPKDSNTHCNLGNAYISQKMTDDAISEFKEAIKYNSYDPELYYFLGNAFYRKESYNEAIQALHQSLHYRHNNPLAHKLIGVIYANHFNDTTRALFHLKETLRLDPQQPMAKELAESIANLSK